MTQEASRFLAAHGILLRHARVGDMDVAYGEFHGREGILHWYVGADDRGLATAMPISPGPLRIEEGAPFRFLDNGRSRQGGRMVRAVLEGLVGRSLASKLKNRFVDLGGEGEGEVGSAMMEVVRPVAERLETQIRLVDAAVKARTSHALHFAKWKLSLDGHSKALWMTAAQAEGLLRFQDRDALLLVAMESGVDPTAHIDVIRAASLRFLWVPEASIRRVPSSVRLFPAMAILLGVVPVDWVPEAGDAVGWEAFGRVADILGSTGLHHDRWRRLVASSKGRWAAFAGLCFEAACQDLLARSPPAPSDAALIVRAMRVGRSSRDVLNAFHAFLEGLSDSVGVGRSAKAHAIALEAVVGDRGLVSLLEAVRLWHERFREMAPVGVTWEPSLPGWTHDGTGIEVVVLGSTDELIAEGSRATGLDHCVGALSFALECLRNRKRILSLRRDGRRLSTAEVYLDGANRGLILVQHQGHGNSDPPADAAVALDAYLNLEDALSAVDGVVENADDLPPVTVERAAAILRSWRPYLTGSWRNAPIEVYAELVAAGCGPEDRAG